MVFKIRIRHGKSGNRMRHDDLLAVVEERKLLNVAQKQLHMLETKISPLVTKGSQMGATDLRMSFTTTIYSWIDHSYPGEGHFSRFVSVSETKES